jgi:hypothetical protein
MTDPRVVYLDQNKWIELLRGEKQKPVADVLDLLRRKVAEGSIVVPLSAAHYLETWHRQNWQSRHDLARLMRELSAYATVAPLHHLQCIEIERLLLENFRSPNCECDVPQISEQLVGRGVNHAFHSRTGRMRFVNNIASPGVQEGAPVAPPAELLATIEKLKVLPGDPYEWWSLAGFADSLEYPEFETRGEHRRGSGQVDRELALAARLASDSWLRHRLDDFLMAEELIEVHDRINHFAFWHNADTTRLMQTWSSKGPEYGAFLLNLMPTRVCMFHMRRAKHRNPQWPWQQHDATDLAALASAVPYADITVTERQWAHVFRTSRLGERFGTTVISKLSDLVPLLT